MHFKSETYEPVETARVWDNASVSEYLLGAHLPIGKGLHTIQLQMDVLRIPTCAVFLKSQRTYKFRKMEAADVSHFRECVRRPEVLLPHSSYLVNLADPDFLAKKSFGILVDDLERCNLLGIKMYNIHPGSDVHKLGVNASRVIAEHLNHIHKLVPEVTILVENMAGQGSVVGSRFEEIRTLIEHVSDKTRIGVCLDTCHLFGAGYDIRTKQSFRDVMGRFSCCVGQEYLKAAHLNDSKKPLGSRADRHESIGAGMIGLEAFEFIMTHDAFRGMPLILETPDPSLYASEIETLRSYVRQDC